MSSGLLRACTLQLWKKGARTGKMLEELMEVEGAEGIMEKVIRKSEGVRSNWKQALQLKRIGL